MSYLVFWEIKNNSIYHYGTIESSNKYLILLGSKIKSKIKSEVPYLSKDGEMNLRDNLTTIVKIPKKNIRFEFLTKEEFNQKYSRDADGFVIYSK
jgi:hypothetical protein